ncbi:MAG: hypothetical protein V3W41_18285 [Planctomycetota bacterium]
MEEQNQKNKDDSSESQQDSEITAKARTGPFLTAGDGLKHSENYRVPRALQSQVAKLQKIMASVSKEQQLGIGQLALRMPPLSTEAQIGKLIAELPSSFSVTNDLDLLRWCLAHVRSDKHRTKILDQPDEEPRYGLSNECLELIGLVADTKTLDRSLRQCAEGLCDNTAPTIGDLNVLDEAIEKFQTERGNRAYRIAPVIRQVRRQEKLKFDRIPDHWVRTYEPSAADRLESPLTSYNSTNGSVLREAGNEFRHSVDYSSVYWEGQVFTFTAQQAAAIQGLWNEWRNRTPVIRESTIGDLAGSVATPFRLKNLFRKDNELHPAFDVMILQVSRGMFRLNLPDD